MNHWTPSPDPLRLEIAMTAARLIAEFGYDYATAKQKAAQSLLGKRRIDRDLLPSNAEIEEEVLEYQALFQSDTQPQRLASLRSIALDLMQRMVAFHPIVYGGLVNGTAGAHSDIHLLAFADDMKEIDYWLLNAGIRFEPVSIGKVNGQEVDAVRFDWQGEGVTLGSMGTVARRGLLKTPADGRPFRCDAAGLAELLERKQTDV